MQYYSAIEKNEILTFATMWMELKRIILSKSESEKDNLISLMWNLRYKTEEHKEREAKII